MDIIGKEWNKKEGDRKEIGNFSSFEVQRNTERKKFYGVGLTLKFLSPLGKRCAEESGALQFFPCYPPFLLPVKWQTNFPIFFINSSGASLSSAFIFSSRTDSSRSLDIIPWRRRGFRKNNGNCEGDSEPLIFCKDHPKMCPQIYCGIWNPSIITNQMLVRIFMNIVFGGNYALSY